MREKKQALTKIRYITLRGDNTQSHYHTPHPALHVNGRKKAIIMVEKVSRFSGEDTSKAQLKEASEY